MLPSTLPNGLLSQANRRFADVLSYPLPEPIDVTYEDTISTNGPSKIGRDTFGTPEIYFTATPFYNFSVRFRLMRLHDLVLIDRIE